MPLLLLGYLCVCVVCLRPLGIQTVTSSHTRHVKILLKVPPSAKDKSSNGSFSWEGLAIFQTLAHFCCCCCNFSSLIGFKEKEPMIL